MNLHAASVRRAALTASLALILPLVLIACGDDSASTSTTSSDSSASAAPKVTGVWSRPASAGGNGAAYMTITGTGNADDLVKATVSSDVAGTVQLHETTSGGTMNGDTGSMDSTTTSMGGDMSGDASTTTSMGGDMMGMREVAQIQVPADGKVVLKPGGYHVMLIDLKRDLKAGESLPITLTFDRGGEVKVTAEVRDS